MSNIRRFDMALLHASRMQCDLGSVRWMAWKPKGAYEKTGVFFMPPGIPISSAPDQARQGLQAVGGCPSPRLELHAVGAAEARRAQFLRLRLWMPTWLEGPSLFPAILSPNFLKGGPVGPSSAGSFADPHMYFKNGS